MFEITNNNENKDLKNMSLIDAHNYYENIKSYKEWGDLSAFETA